MVWKFILWKSTKLPHVAGTFCFHAVQKRNPKMWNFMFYQFSKNKVSKNLELCFFATLFVKKNIVLFADNNKVSKTLELYFFYEFVRQKIPFFFLTQIKFQKLWNFILEKSVLCFGYVWFWLFPGQTIKTNQTTHSKQWFLQCLLCVVWFVLMVWPGNKAKPHIAKTQNGFFSFFVRGTLFSSHPKIKFQNFWNFISVRKRNGIF